MTTEPVALDELLQARERMMRESQKGLDMQERGFLLSLVRNKTDWSQLEIAHLDQLPAIQWKLRNLAELARANPKKFTAQVDALEHAFEKMD